MQLILYGIVVLIVAFIGYYVGNMYKYPMVGAGIGILGGLIAAGAIYYAMGDGSHAMARMASPYQL